MTFFVRKKLALGPIRFGVSPRKPLDAIDTEPALSTGPSGEFVRRRNEGYFFGDQARFDAPVIQTAKSIRQTPFLSSLKPDGSPRSYGFLVLMIVGALLILLGFSVVLTKGKQGWVEVVIGVVMMAVPIVLTAKKRQQISEQEERDRAEREATERRNREMLTSYTRALDGAVSDRSAGSFERLRAERAALTLPYEVWGAAAQRAMLQIGFDELARRGPPGANEACALLRDASNAAGLSPESVTEIERELYRTHLWHLLADDRLGDTQEELLKAIGKGFEVWERDVPLEADVTEQFRRLRGITNKSLPRTQCTVQLGFQEYCIHEVPLADGKLHITNKRLIVDARKKTEVPLPKVFDLEVDADNNVLTIKTDQKKPIELRPADLIVTAAMIDLASSIDTRPKGFA